MIIEIQLKKEIKNERDVYKVFLFPFSDKYISFDVSSKKECNILRSK